MFEADIKACFDEIDHTALMGAGAQARRGTSGSWAGSRRSCGPGVLTEDGLNRETITGTPQGGILSPLLANIALSVLDEHFAAKWEALGPEWTRAKHRRAGGCGHEARPLRRRLRSPHPRPTRDAEALWDEVGAVLAPMGLRLSTEKTRICHIDEGGFDFLGWRIQRRAWRSRTGKKAIYTYPSKKSLASIIGKVRMLTRRATHRTLADLLRRLNPTLRGWCTYFRHGVSSRTFGYLDHFAFWRVVGWLRKRHLGLNMHTLVRRYLPGWHIRAGGIDMFRANAVAIERYRYRGGTKIPTRGRVQQSLNLSQRHEYVESRMR